MTAADPRPAPSSPCPGSRLWGQFPSPCGVPRSPAVTPPSPRDCRWARPAGCHLPPVPCTSPLAAGAADGLPKPVPEGPGEPQSAPARLGTPFFSPSALLLHAALHPVTPENFPTPAAVPVAQRSHPSFGPSRLGPVPPHPGRLEFHAGPTPWRTPPGLSSCPPKIRLPLRAGFFSSPQILSAPHDTSCLHVSGGFWWFLPPKSRQVLKPGPGPLSSALPPCGLTPTTSLALDFEAACLRSLSKPSQAL